MKLDDLKPGKRLMALFVGENGTGKSGAAASFAKLGRTKFFDFDGRMAGVADTIRTAKFSPEISANIEYETFGPKNYPQFMTEFEKLQENCPYKVIVIDSLTSLSLTIVNYVLLSKGGRIRSDRFAMVSVPTWDEINAETSWISQLLDICKILPCHVILTAHPVKRIEVDGKNVSRAETLVAFGNKIDGLVPGYFDEIWHFTKKRAIVGGGLERIVETSGLTAKTALESLGLPKTLDISGRALFDVVNEKVKIGE